MMCHYGWPPYADFVTPQQRHLTCPFAPVTITTAARGLCDMNVNKCRFGALAEMNHLSWEDSVSLSTTITGAFKGPLYYYLFWCTVEQKGPMLLSGRIYFSWRCVYAFVFKCWAKLEANSDEMIRSFLYVVYNSVCSCFRFQLTGRWVPVQ